MSVFDSPLAFVYAIIWIPSLIFFVGLSYYQSQADLPRRLKILRWVCLAVVVTIPAGLTVATETMLLMK